MDALAFLPRAIFRNKKAHPLALSLLLSKTFTLDWLEWEPETLRACIIEKFGGPIEVNWHKVQAVKTVQVAPGLVFDQWEVFLPTITALNSVVPDFNVIQTPTVPRLYAGVDMLRQMDPDEDFSDEVKRFIVSTLLFRGVYYAPAELSFVQELLRRPFYKCPRCGNQEYVEEDFDGVCDSCGREWHTKITGTVRADAQPVTLIHTYDESPIARRLEEALRDPESFVPHDDVEADVQVAKLLMSFEYRDLRRREFLEQKEVLGL